MKPGCAKHERGAALLVLLAVISLGASWLLVSQLNAESGSIDAVRKNRNAEVLNRAKQALIGYVALQAAQTGENNPGALPCPEAAAYYGDPAQEGIAGPNCSLPKVGRFPWRTLGLDKLVDSAGEPLWYVVGPGWAYTSGSNTTINSNSTGQLTVDGTANNAVALIIAPGPAIGVAAATGCTAWSQVRPTTGTPDWRNYLECENATYPTPDATFVTTGPSESFNDQVIRVTVADIMPAIEAAIASRMEREIVPGIKNMYATASWGLSSTNPLFPYPAPLNNPAGTTPTSSNYQGVAGTTTGLLPVTSTSCAGDPRCSTSFVTWKTPQTPTIAMTNAFVLSSSCTVAASTVQCTGTYLALAAGELTVTLTANNVAMAMRQLDVSKVTIESQRGVLGWQTNPTTVTGAFNNDGSAAISSRATVQGLLFITFQFRVTADIGALADHPLLDSTNATTGWFVRNEWHRLVFYAPAAGHTAAVRPALPACITAGVLPATACLSVTNVTPTAAQRAFLILAGRSIDGSSRPSATLSNYLESGNATAAYERKTVSAGMVVPAAQRFNDRIVVIDTN